MKTTNKIMLSLLTCLTLSNVTVHSFFNNNGQSNALTGAAIGGLAGGRKGAGIGLGVGMATDMMSAAAQNDRRYRDDYDREPRSSKRSRKQRQRDLENENAQLREENLQNENLRLRQELESLKSRNQSN